MTKPPAKIQACFDQIISYGGLPMRRADVYAAALHDTGSKRAADLFAFGPNAMPMDCEPISFEQFLTITSAE